MYNVIIYKGQWLWYHKENSTHLF